MTIKTKRSAVQRAIRLSVGIPLLAVFLTACGSGGGDGNGLASLFENDNNNNGGGTTQGTNPPGGTTVAPPGGTTQGTNPPGGTTVAPPGGTTQGTNPPGGTTVTPPGGTTTGDVGGTSQLSCTGNRVWGPADEGGFSYYLTEPGNQPGVEPPPGCRLIWQVDPARNCRNVFTVRDEVVTEVTGSGELNFDGSPLPVAGITLQQLANIPPCPQEGETDGSTTSGGDNIVGNENVTPLNCNGNRVWGPADGENGELIYITEPAGLVDNPRECALFWRVDTTRNCVVISSISDQATANATQSGSLEFTVGSSVFELGAANISLQELVNLGSCP